MTKTHADEIAEGNRFGFGKNWRKYLQVVDELSVEQAMQSLSDNLGISLSQKTFLDIGSGSGLFSLSAYRMGADVYSLDYDPDSVRATRSIKEAMDIDNLDSWAIEEGSVLDSDYLDSLGLFDVVYSWGVLHHTGSMWQAISNASKRVKHGGTLFIAIYNDQGIISKYWLVVKKLYNKNWFFRVLMIVFHFPYLYLLRKIIHLIQGTSLDRGMSLYYDMHDWLGGLPFEVSTPEKVSEFLKQRGFQCHKINTVGGRMGCNEFIFRKTSQISE